MSVLLLAPPEPEGASAVRLLVSEGDDVSVVAPPGEADSWRRLGAHVAGGDPSDADLVERVAQHARTIVVFDDGPQEATEVVAAVIRAGAYLREAPRVVFHTRSSAEGPIGALRASALDYVILRVPRRRRLGGVKGAPAPDRVATAISAADDLPGNPRLDVDLARPEGWDALGL